MCNPAPPPRSWLALALAPIFATAASAQSFQGIGDLSGGNFTSAAYGISADGGTIVGVGTTAAGTEAVYWRNGALVSLGDLAGGPVETYAASANFDGSIIVGTGRDGMEHRGVRWDGPSYNLTLLPQVSGFPGGAQGTGISANGQTICGWGTDNQTTAYSIVTGYRIDNGVLTGLPYALSGSTSDSGAYATNADGSVIVGRVRTGGVVYHGCYWVGTTLHVPPDLNGGADYSQIFGVSADGSVKVGAANSSAAPSYAAGEPCRWENDVALGLGAAPGGTAVGNAMGCNYDGSIIVGHTTIAGSPRAFIWDSIHGVRELSIVLTNDYGLDLSGWTLQVARAITPDGSAIVGSGLNPAGNSEGWIVRLPCPAMTSYCVAKANSLACVPSIHGTGTPSATAGSGFLVSAEQVLASKAGLCFYSVSGPNSAPFQGGHLCVLPPTKRTPLQTSSASGAPPCTGLYSFDFNARIASGIDPALVEGQQVWSQYWTRDGGMPSGTGLSNGLTFTICQ